MPELQKLSPHRDLQCYFLTPSAIAAMSGASETGFTVSGKWRQQFDWCVVEWNRDNVFEHPLLRPLPDGDLSGLVLNYDEERTGCIPLESNLVPIVDWNDLRIWASDENGVETLYQVNLWPGCATPMSGSYIPAAATMTLTASPGIGNRVGLAFLETHYYHVVGPQDDLSDIASGIAQQIASNPDFTKPARRERQSNIGLRLRTGWQPLLGTGVGCIYWGCVPHQLSHRNRLQCTQDSGGCSGAHKSCAKASLDVVCRFTGYKLSTIRIPDQYFQLECLG